MESLFPQQRPADAGNRQQTSLISFKAGKCILSERGSNGKFTVTADKRRGTLSLSKSSEGLMHFRWTDRSSGVIEDHRIVFPDEVTFKKCKTGRETDRVYLLKFTQPQQPWMFWMQEKSSEKDTENAGKVNEYANNPQAADAAVAAIAAAATSAAPVPGLMSERWAQLMGLPGGAPVAAAAATAAPTVPDLGPGSFGNLDLSSLLGAGSTPAATRGGLTSDDLQRAMMGMSSPPAAPSAARSARLEDILSSDAVIATGILNDPAVRASLIEQLPEGQRTDAHLEESIRSPQFRQSLGQLSGALESDSINSVMANFNIDPTPGMNNLIRGDGVGAFLTALQADVDATNVVSESAAVAASPAAATTTNGNNTTEEKEDDTHNDTRMDEA